MANFLEGDTDLLSNLPQEITRQIMGRLSIRNIKRCKCVCKSWRDLIEKGEFDAKAEDFKAKSLEIQRLKSKIEELKLVSGSNEVRGEFGSRKLVWVDIWMAKVLKIIPDTNIETQPLKGVFDKLLSTMDQMIQKRKGKIEELEMLLASNEVNGESKNRWFVAGGSTVVAIAVACFVRVAVVQRRTL